MNKPKFSAVFKKRFIEATTECLQHRPIVAAGLSVEVVRRESGLVLRAFLVDGEYKELAEIAETPYTVGEVVTLFSLDQPFQIRLFNE